MLSSFDFLKYSEIAYRMWFNTNSILVPQENLFTAERRNPSVILPFIYDGIETFATIYSDESKQMSGALNSLKDGDKTEIIVSVDVRDCFDVDFFFPGVMTVKDVGTLKRSKGAKPMPIVQKYPIYERKEGVIAELHYVNPKFTSDDLSNMMMIIALSLGTEIVTRRGTC